MTKFTDTLRRNSCLLAIATSILLGNPEQLAAQPEQFFQTLGSDLSAFVEVGGMFLTGPLRYDSGDLLTAGALIGVTAAATFLDVPIREQVLKTQSASVERITLAGERLGRPLYPLILGGTLYAGGHLFKDTYLRKTGLMLTEAIVMNGIVTQVLKIMLGRSRPGEEEGNMDLFGPELSDEDHSLPSGHTSTAFAVATVLSQRFNNVFASIAVYSLAGLTAFQRIYKDRHWVSDTVLGALIGTLNGLGVVRLYGQLSDREGDGSEIRIMPGFSSRGYSLAVSLTL